MGQFTPFLFLIQVLVSDAGLRFDNLPQTPLSNLILSRISRFYSFYFNKFSLKGKKQLFLEYFQFHLQN